MSRTQVFQAPTQVALTNVAAALNGGVSLIIKSVIIQAASSNAGVVTVGDSSNQVIELAAGRGLTMQGDEMDFGGTGQFNLASVFVKSSAASGDKVNVIITTGV